MPASVVNWIRQYPGMLSSPPSAGLLFRLTMPSQCSTLPLRRAPHIRKVCFHRCCGYMSVSIRLIVHIPISNLWYFDAIFKTSVNEVFTWHGLLHEELLFVTNTGSNSNFDKRSCKNEQVDLLHRYALVCSVIMWELAWKPSLWGAISAKI